MRAAGLGAGALLLLLFVGFSLWRLGARQQELEMRVEAEVTDSTRFATTIALIQTLQARQDTVRQKIGVIREVDQRRYVWPHLMDEISRSVPQFTWLTQVSASEIAPPAAPAGAGTAADSARVAPAPPVGPAFSIQGHAGSTQALTRFMKNLEVSAFIRDVTLVTSEQVEVDGRMIHRFTLEARYELADSSAIETVPILVLN